MPHTNKEEGEKKYIGLDSGLSFEKQEYLNNPSPTEEKKPVNLGKDVTCNYCEKQLCTCPERQPDGSWKKEKKGEATGESWSEKLEELINDIRRDNSTDSVHIHKFVRKTLSITEQASFRDGELNGQSQVINISLDFIMKKGLSQKEYIDYIYEQLSALSQQEHTKE